MAYVRAGGKKKRWVAVLTVVVIVAMILSLPAAYIFNLIGGEGETPPGGSNFDLEAWVESLQQESERLEEYRQEYGDSTAVLEELAGIYYNLSIFDQDEENKRSYREKTAGVYLDLLELEPENTGYRLELIMVYHALEDEETALQQAARVEELLEAKPDPAASLMLLNTYRYLEQEELLLAHAGRLREYFEQQAGEDMENLQRYYYAYFLAEYLEEKEAALAQLDLVLETEPADSRLYTEAAGYRDTLLNDDNSEEEADG